ncbi:MAG TPA: chemotaxis protein CheC, partial [Anaerolineae bacterium]|nr:chemotaxis protein CheC [Anaerolineae bacterium]
MLTEVQQDALAELLLIGVGRATAALSTLVGKRIEMHTPQVKVVPVSELKQALEALSDGELATVHQLFSGQIAGNALLALRSDDARRLLTILLKSEPPRDGFRALDRDVLIEIGNVLLGACLGTLGNVLDVHFSFSVPQLRWDALEDLVTTLRVEREPLCYAIVI